MLLVLFVAAGAGASAQSVTLSTEEQTGRYNVTADNVALHGYDVVAYHTQHEAVSGSAVHALEHDGVTYHFASEQHKMMFSQQPDAFLPKYGGFCAFGVGRVGKKFDADPEVFKLVDGDLYLFFRGPIPGQGDVNSIVPWNRMEASLRAAAEENWATIDEAD